LTYIAHFIPICSSILAKSELEIEFF